ncbi:hypothetical protein GCM10022384_07550 [Streptomyces marokkonensis]|uniref:Uncharacterized protein n=1 Tax=Streptomyces marokkonensis TaxID=324855 RepID=A0ABP7NYX1_9ACTN
MRLAWVRIRFTIRKTLGIRDQRQGNLRLRIREMEAQRRMSREQRRSGVRLARWALAIAALAVVAWVAVTS